MHQVCHAVDTMGDTRVLFKCATAVILCAACALDVRHPAIPSQRACASAVEKTPSFSFCQVDMYALVYVYVRDGRSRYKGRTIENGSSQHLLSPPKDNPVNIKHTFIIDIITKVILHNSHHNNPV